MSTARTLRTTSHIGTSVKALAFGVLATAALTAGLAHAQAQREREARTIKLETVYITGTRQVARADVQTLPTVYITGRRATTLDDTQVAAASVTGTSISTSPSTTQPL